MATRLLHGGTEGNARLTAVTGFALLVLLAVEGVTILAIRPLLSLHVFIGLLLIPPVALKLAATGYRFVRYYTRNVEYVPKGPPILLMRMLVAPGLVAATLGVFATGVALLVIGAGGGIVLGLHKASFVIWLVVFGIHVLVYALRVSGLVVADWGRGRGADGMALRYGGRGVGARRRADARRGGAAGGRAVAPLVRRRPLTPIGCPSGPVRKGR